MRTTMTAVLVAAFLLMSSGCVAVLGNQGYYSDRHHVVEMDGHFYVVDVKKNTAQRVEIVEPDEIETITIIEINGD